MIPYRGRSEARLSGDVERGDGTMTATDRRLELAIEGARTVWHEAVTAEQIIAIAPLPGEVGVLWAHPGGRQAEFRMEVANPSWVANDLRKALRSHHVPA